MEQTQVRSGRIELDLASMRHAVAPARLLAATGYVALGGILALVVQALVPHGIGSPLAPVLLMQCVGVFVLLLGRPRNVALLGLGIVAVGPLLFPAAAPAALLLATAGAPVLAFYVLREPPHRIATIASYGWILPAVHDTFGYEGWAHALPLLIVVAFATVTLARLGGWGRLVAASYLMIVLFLGYA